MKTNELAIHLQATGIGDSVLGLKQIKESFNGDAQRSQLVSGYFDKNLFGLLAGNIDLAHPIHQDQFPPQEVDVIHQLRVGKSIPEHCDHQPEYIAVIIVDPGGLHTGWKTPLQVANLAAQFIPDLRQFIGIILIFYLHRDLGETRGRYGTDVIHIGELLHGIFYGESNFLFYLCG